jgi:hypothetical protein
MPGTSMIVPSRDLLPAYLSCGLGLSASITLIRSLRRRPARALDIHRELRGVDPWYRRLVLVVAMSSVTSDYYREIRPDCGTP